MKSFTMTYERTNYTQDVVIVQTNTLTVCLWEFVGREI